ncbi:unnamed protein product [Clavelina lepadiformis]|uniref:Uncharacterized protein n=1 Tax=Clavelina lepadiformis TaxID=159417 RepID=A0ABP0H266_CLALP
MIYGYSGNVLKTVTLSEVIPWIPAMLLYVGSIYSGSKALAHLSIPVFLLSHGASDVILMLCDSHMPTGGVHASMPFKIGGMMLAFWSAHYNAELLDLVWIILYTLFAGAYRTLSFWYTTSQWPYCGLTALQRQYLNNMLGFASLLSTAVLLGHHNHVGNHFPHLGSVRFYIGCLLSGMLSWAVNLVFDNISSKTRPSSIEAMQLASKVMALILSMHVFPVAHSLILWAAILLGVVGDVLHMIGKLMEEKGNHNKGLSDIMIGP